MPNTNSDALLLCPSFLVFFPIVCRSVLVYSRALTLFLIFLHVAVCLSHCLPHKSSPKYSILYLSLFSLCLSFSFPFPLCYSWHRILPAKSFTEGGVFLYVCVRLHICGCICVSVCTFCAHWVNSFVFLARSGGVWQWTKCQCVRVEWEPAPCVIACPRSDTPEPITEDRG